MDMTFILDNQLPLSLKRSTQQYCEKCGYTCSSYGFRWCPRCKCEFDKKWWSYSSYQKKQQ